MFYLKIIIYLIWLTVNRAIPQINLEYTNENIDEFRHNCLSMVVDPLNWENDREIITVCMSELPSKFLIEDDELISKFTFDQLAKQNITSEQLYLWQTPMDTYAFKIIQNVQQNRSVCVNHVHLDNDVNFVRMDLVYH